MGSVRLCATVAVATCNLPMGVGRHSETLMGETRAEIRAEHRKGWQRSAMVAAAC